MATVQHRRIAAILLQDAIGQLNAAVAPLHALASVWTVSGINDDLPSEAEVKAVLDGYAALSIPGLNARIALADVNASTDPFDGQFAVPATAFVVPFVFAGPVWAPLEQAQGFGVALTLQRLTLFVSISGTTGADLTVDVRCDGVSMLSAVVSVPGGSGENIHVIVPDSQLITTSIPAGSVLSAHLVTAPDDAQGVTVNVWLTQS
ncbi:MAG: hypothetical protein PVH19_00075 [Planctomycetia bacterium]|jgi:hypothetical protein